MKKKLGKEGRGGFGRGLASQGGEVAAEAYWLAADGGGQERCRDLISDNRHRRQLRLRLWTKYTWQTLGPDSKKKRAVLSIYLFSSSK